MDRRPVRALLAVPLSIVLVATTAAPATSEDTSVSWEQVRTALMAGPGKGHRPTPPPAGNVSVAIPDLSWAIDDPTADPGVRRAACHQVTGMDDEKVAPLAACLAHVDPDRHHGRGHQPGHPGKGHHTENASPRPRSHPPHVR